MKPGSSFLSAVFLAILGRCRVGDRGYARASSLLIAALAEEKEDVSRLAPRLSSDSTKLPGRVYDALISEAAARAGRREEDGILRYRSFWPEIYQIAKSVDAHLRGSTIEDTRVRAILGVNGL